MDRWEIMLLGILREMERQIGAERSNLKKQIDCLQEEIQNPTHPEEWLDWDWDNM
jgi:hypothetical protein